MQGFARRAFLVLCLSIVLLELPTLFLDLPCLYNLLSMVGLCLLMISVVLSHLRANIVPLLLIGLTLIIGIKSLLHFNLAPFWIGLREMQPMIVIVLMIPLVTMVFRQEPYLESVFTCVAKWIKSSVDFHFWLLVITQFIAFLLLPTTVPVVYEFVSGFMDQEQWNYIKSTAIYRGGALAGVWAISFPSFAYATDKLHAPLLNAMLNGLMLSIIGTILSVVFIFTLVLKKRVPYKIKAINNVKEKSSNEKKTVYEFLFLLSTLLGSILVVNTCFSLSLLISIPFIVLLWTLMYFIVKKKIRVFYTEIKLYFSKGIFKKNREINIFLTAGLLISSLNYSQVGTYIIDYLFRLSNQSVFFNILILLPLIMTFLGCIGIPPSAAMILVAGFVKDMPLHYSSETIVMALTLGTVTSVLVSPLAVPSILLSSVNGLPPWQNSVQKNYFYAIVFFVVCECYIFIVNFLLN